jgi:hypothetical protein
MADHSHTYSFHFWINPFLGFHFFYIPNTDSFSACNTLPIFQLIDKNTLLIYLWSASASLYCQHFDFWQLDSVIRFHSILGILEKFRIFAFILKTLDNLSWNLNYFLTGIYMQPFHILVPFSRVRKYPPHLLVCRKRRLNGAFLQMRPEKPRPRVTAGVAR